LICVRARKMFVEVNDTNGKKFEFELTAASVSVADLKARLLGESGVPVEYQLLFEHEGKTPLSNDAVIGQQPSSWLSALGLSSFVSGSSDIANSDLYVKLRLVYELEGGCNEGFICCDCCGATSICRPCECIGRCCCCFSGCDLQGWNSIQCGCWRIYCCASDEQKDQAVGHD
jgi:hypothetical protein